MGLASVVLSKLEKVRKTPFSTRHEAINCFLHSNPARQKVFNPYEPEARGKPFYYEFEENHPERKWARILVCIRKVLRECRPIQAQAWILCTIGERSNPYTSRLTSAGEGKRIAERMARYGERLAAHPREAAQLLGVGKSTVYRWLEKINEDLESEFRRRGLLPADDEPKSH
jgi:hypothetical protein